LVSSDDLDVSILQLRCFIAVAESGSINKAARRIGIASPGLSRAIARLEKEVGVKVFHRSTHAVSLTEEGRDLIEPAREAVGSVSRFREAAAGKADTTGAGIVRISAPVAFARQVLCPLLPAFAAAHPAIRLDVRMTNTLVDLAEEGIDLALRAGSISRVPGHIQRSWFTFPWVVCAAPSYLARRARPEEPSHLDTHDLIGFRNGRTGQIQGWSFRSPNAGSVGHYHPRPKFAFDDGDAGWRAVLEGAGIGCAPLWLASEALRQGRAVELLRKWRSAPVNMSILRRDRLVPARVAKVQTFLLRNVPDLSHRP